MVLGLILIQVVLPTLSAAITGGTLAAANVSAATITLLGLSVMLLAVVYILLILGIVRT